MAESLARPPLAICVAWHPGNVKGATIAKRIRRHFGSDRYRNAAGGAGVSVLFRGTQAPSSAKPLPIDWDDAEATAVVALLDGMLVNDPGWVEYIQGLFNAAADKGLGAMVIPVCMEAGVRGVGLDVQALCWDRWAGTDGNRNRRLLRELTSEFIRILRQQLHQAQNREDPQPLEQYLKRVPVVLSHSKHDDHGSRVAEAVRCWLRDNSSLTSFLDIHDIPAGLPSAAVIEHTIRAGVLLAIYTDSYSSRAWCRQEVIVTKLNNVPMLVVDCLRSVDDRALPYLGNVPVIRMNPKKMNRIEQVGGLLLDEVFKDFLWRCRVEGSRQSHPRILFTPRPPEIISLLSLPAGPDGQERLIVYPDPPMRSEESALLCDTVPDLRLRSFRQWQGEVN